MTEAVKMYDEGYQEGYNAAIKAVMEAKREQQILKARAEKQNKIARRQHAVSLIGQKALGALLLAVSVAGILITKGDFGAAVVTIPVSAVVLLGSGRIFG